MTELLLLAFVCPVCIFSMCQRGTLNRFLLCAWLFLDVSPMMSPRPNSPVRGKVIDDNKANVRREVIGNNCRNGDTRVMRRRKRKTKSGERLKGD